MRKLSMVKMTPAATHPTGESQLREWAADSIVPAVHQLLAFSQVCSFSLQPV